MLVVLIATLALIVNPSWAQVRQVSINPCGTGVCSDNVAVVRSTTSVDSMVYVWSTVGAPAVSMAYCPSSSDCNVSFNRTELLALHPGGAMFTGAAVLEAQAFVVSTVVEFDDSDKSSLYAPSKVVKTMDLSQSKWTTMELASNNLTITTCTIPKVVCLTFNAETHTQRSPNPPRQLLSANATAALVAVHNFTFVQPKTKLALGLQFISLDTKPVEHASPNTIGYFDHRSIDDEYSPTVFHVMQVRMSNNTRARNAVYTQWKPVGYSSSPAENTASTNAQLYLPEFNNATQPPPVPSMASVLASTQGLIGLRASHMAFGEPQDKKYSPSHMQWSIQIGYGYYIATPLSASIITMIVFSLGLPIIILVGGAIYLFVKKRKAKTASYGPIN